MISFLKIRYVNYINLLLFAAYFFVVFLISVKKSEGKQETTGIVASVDNTYKYKTNYLGIKFQNNESIVLAYPNSFFSVEDFLRIKIGDSLQYSVLNNNRVRKIKNISNENELSELFFSIQESKGYQIVIIFLLLIFNIIQMKKLRNTMQLISSNYLRRGNLIEKVNDFTRKHFFITLVGLCIIVYLFYITLVSIKQNQIFFDNVYIYKYLVLLSGFLIPAPYIVINFKLLKKINSLTK